MRSEGIFAVPAILGELPESARRQRYRARWIYEKDQCPPKLVDLAGQYGPYVLYGPIFTSAC